ncbi:MAG TPA: GNAT family protein [Opitutaceae bacterium]|nr:GNAT family protein [Opitutaceae bacterium]
MISPDLELRILEPAHAAELFALIDANRATLREWLTWVDGTTKRADTEKYIAETVRDNRESRAGTCGIWSTGKLVGVIGHNRIDWAARVAFPGWWLVRAAEGKGIMTQCCQAFIADAFQQLQVHRIVVGVATANLRGQALVKRLGFKQVSTLRNAEILHGRGVDHFIYSLLPEQAGIGGPARRHAVNP